MVTLEGQHIELRELDFSDWQRVHRYVSLKEVCQFQPWGPNSEDETKGYVQQALMDAKRERRTRFVLGAIDKAHACLIGAGELNIRDLMKREGEIGFILHPDEWGKGYATEIGELLLAFGFHDLHLHRIYATCDPRNIGSFRVLEKIGMTKEGNLRDHTLLTGGWRDSLLYSVLELE